MGLFSGIAGKVLGTAVGSAFGMPQLGGMIGGAVFGGGGSSGGGSAGAVGQATTGAVKDAYQYAMPWDVAGAYGGLDFDPQSRTVEQSLSPEYQAIYDRLMGRAGTYSPIIEKYTQDPVAAAMGLSKERSALREPQRRLKREALEARLFEQGRLGSTGGAGQQQALEESFATQDLLDEQSALQDVLNIGQQYRAYEGGDLTTGTKIAGLPMEYSSLATAGKVTPNPALAGLQAYGTALPQVSSNLASQQQTSAKVDLYNQLANKAQPYVTDFVGGLFNSSGIPADDYNYFGY